MVVGQIPGTATTRWLVGGGAVDLQASPTGLGVVSIVGGGSQSSPSCCLLSLTPFPNQSLACSAR